MKNKNNHFLNSELSTEEKNKDEAKFHIAYCCILSVHMRFDRNIDKRQY